MGKLMTVNYSTSIWAATLTLHLFSVAAYCQVQPLPRDSTALARRFSELLLRGTGDSLAPRLSSRLIDRTEIVSELSQLSAAISERAGNEVAVLEERWVWRNRQRQYWRFMSMSNFSDLLVLRLIVNPDGKISGWGVNPASQLPETDPGPPATTGPATSPPPAQTASSSAANLSLSGFRGLWWLTGRWEGTGFGALAGVGKFFEEYHMLNDSTMLMRSFERAPFAVPTDSTTFELRAGVLRAVPARGTARSLTAISGDTLTWSNGVKYIRISDDRWRARFPVRATDATERYYEMRKVPALP